MGGLFTMAKSKLRAFVKKSILLIVAGMLFVQIANTIGNYDEKIRSLQKNK